jgi:hypothetical protein
LRLNSVVLAVSSHIFVYIWLSSYPIAASMRLLPYMWVVYGPPFPTYLAVTIDRVVHLMR